MSEATKLRKVKISYAQVKAAQILVDREKRGLGNVSPVIHAMAKATPVPRQVNISVSSSEAP